MRPGPPLSVLTGPVAVGVEIDLVRGGTVLAAGVEATDCKLEVQSTRVVPGAVTLSLPLSMLPDGPGAPVGNHGQRVHVTMLLEWPGGADRVDIGWYLVTEWSEEKGHVAVTALDLMQTLEEDPFPWGSSPAAGTLVSQEAQRLAGALPVEVDDPDKDDYVSPLTQWGTSRTEAIRDLCVAHGLLPLVRADGVLHLVARRQATVIDETYTGRDLLLDAPRQSVPRRPNRIYATGSVRDGDNETRYTGVATDTEGPYVPQLYGWVSEHKEIQSVTGQADVDAAARALMAEKVSATVVRSVEIVPDPRIEIGDVIAVHTDGGEVLAGRVSAYSLPVGDASATMRVDVEELLW